MLSAAGGHLLTVSIHHACPPAGFFVAIQSQAPRSCEAGLRLLHPHSQYARPLLLNWIPSPGDKRPKRTGQLCFFYRSSGQHRYFQASFRHMPARSRQVLTLAGMTLFPLNTLFHISHVPRVITADIIRHIVPIPDPIDPIHIQIVLIPGLIVRLSVPPSLKL